MTLSTQIRSPAAPPLYTIDEIDALFALYRGVATPEQQHLVLEWIVRSVSCATSLCFQPSATEIAFDAGRASVGKHLERLLSSDLDDLRRHATGAEDKYSRTVRERIEAWNARARRSSAAD